MIKIPKLIVFKTFTEIKKIKFPYSFFAQFCLSEKKKNKLQLLPSRIYFKRFCSIRKYAVKMFLVVTNVADLNKQ